MLTENMLRMLWPQGDSKVPGLIAGIAASAPTVFPKYGLTSDLLIAHAMAQFSHECGAGTEVVENLNYSADGLMATWPSRFNAVKAAAFAHHPQQIADEVYNGRMGNAPGSDDGWNYRGRGGAQTTGRDGYESVETKTGIAVLANPDLINDPAQFLECAVADFILCGCLPFAAADDIQGVTKHLNGGFIGLDQRTVWLARWKTALSSDGAAPAHSTIWLQQALNTLGAEPPLLTDGKFGPQTSAALKDFQQAQGLPATGSVSDQTFAAIDQALTTTQRAA
jgi:putative chitinase